MNENLSELTGKLNKLYLSYRKCFLQQSQLHGLYVGQPQLLNYVKSNPGCTQNDIAAALGVSPASIAFSSKRLQSAGLLQKQVNNLNMRCNKLYVTTEGMEILDKFSGDFDELNAKMFEGFTDEELVQLENFAQRIETNLEQFMKSGKD